MLWQENNIQYYTTTGSLNIRNHNTDCKRVQTENEKTENNWKIKTKKSSKKQWSGLVEVEKRSWLSLLFLYLILSMAINTDHVLYEPPRDLLVLMTPIFRLRSSWPDCENEDDPNKRRMSPEMQLSALLATKNLSLDSEWTRGQRLGRGSFGFVYEADSE